VRFWCSRAIGGGGQLVSTHVTVSVRATSQNTKLTPTSTRHHATIESRIQDAIEDIESLDLCKTFSYREIAAKHNVDRTTLSRRHQGLQATREAKELNQAKLHPQQVQELIDYIKFLTARRLLPTRTMIVNFASTMAKSRVSDSWITRFLNSNADQLTYDGTTLWTETVTRLILKASIQPSLRNYTRRWTGMR
jgi:hypothetical protein